MPSHPRNPFLLMVLAAVALFYGADTKGSAVSGQDYVPLPGTKKITVYALPGAQGTIKLKLVPTTNSYGALVPAQAKLRLADPD